MEQGTHPQQEILTYHFQFEVFFGIKQQKTLQNSTQHKTGKVQALTVTWTATATSHIQHYKLIYLHCLFIFYQHQCHNLQLCCHIQW
jgi:hypothetical protein